jgi:hypothetical protein
MSKENIVVHAWGQGPTFAQLMREIFDVILVLPLFVVTPLLRPWHRRWGTTDTEAVASMPGDNIITGCQYIVTRAISINTPPSDIWPWLLQIGFGKAGYYSNDLLDNFGHLSADKIISEFQNLKIGDWIPMYSKVNDTTAFKVVEIDPLKSILWQKPDSTWSWILSPTEFGTRLITRIRILYRWNIPAEAIFSLILNEFGDFPMMRKMLKNIKRNAESIYKKNNNN